MLQIFLSTFSLFSKQINNAAEFFCLLILYFRNQKLMEKSYNRSIRADRKTTEKMYTTLFLLQQQIGNHLLGNSTDEYTC
jgi:hypothetical protein